MKVLFIADIHIKLGQKNVPVEWALNRYKLFNDKISKLQESVDLVILGGDVFDRMPTIEELEVYFNFIRIFNKETLVIPGNHESVKKTTTFLTNLKAVSNAINHNVHIIDDFDTRHGMDFIPYNKLKEYHHADVDFHSRILVTHVRGEIPPHVKPEVPLTLFERWDVVLAGDLHSYENSQLNILYPGSPMSTSFHRNPVDNGVIILDTESLEQTFIPLKLPQMLRKTITAGEAMPPTDYDHTIYEVEGDMSQLQDVANHELLDKKVAKRNIDVALMLEPDMTLGQELGEYLRYILQLNDDAVGEVLEEFHAMEAKLSD